MKMPNPAFKRDSPRSGRAPQFYVGHLKSMDVISAHKFSSQHRAQIQTSEICGCFYCLQMFSPSKIVEWVDSEQTALCPKCGIDSVVGSASGEPLTQNFLKEIHDQWF